MGITTLSLLSSLSLSLVKRDEVSEHAALREWTLWFLKLELIAREEETIRTRGNFRVGHSMHCTGGVYTIEWPYGKTSGREEF